MKDYGFSLTTEVTADGGGIRPCIEQDESWLFRRQSLEKSEAGVAP